MLGDVVCTHGPFKLTLDFVEVDLYETGVRVRLDIHYLGSRQHVSWAVDHAWINYAELRKFESDLLAGDEARLHDMSDYPLIHLERVSTEGATEENLTINPPAQRQSADGDAITARLKIGNGAMRALHSSLSEFAKWW
ncbi:MAG: hypothetical protein ABIT83_21470 [Massilia sp.]